VNSTLLNAKKINKIKSTTKQAQKAELTREGLLENKIEVV